MSQAQGDTRTRRARRAYGWPITLLFAGACDLASANNDDGAVDAGSPPEDVTVPDANDPLPPLPPPNMLGGICTEHNHAPVHAAGLKLTETFDYVGVREWSGLKPVGVPASDWTSSSFETISEVGTRCATATSPACSTMTDRHPIPTGPLYCPQACLELSVVTTKGDSAKRWATSEELLSLFGKIDSPDEALLLAASHGYSIACAPPRPPRYPIAIPVGVEPNEDGFDVIATRAVSTCHPFTIRRYKLRVSSAGEVTEVESADFDWPTVCA